jgi:hypothetical protein
LSHSLGFDFRSFFLQLGPVLVPFRRLLLPLLFQRQSLRVKFGLLLMDWLMMMGLFIFECAMEEFG